MGDRRLLAASVSGCCNTRAAAGDKRQQTTQVTAAQG